MEPNVYMKLDDRKAGMVELDKDKINQLIQEASQGSMFYKTQLQKEAKLKLKVESQQNMLKTFNNHQRKLAKLKMEKFIKDATNKQDYNRTIAHIDMDAFFAAVEIRDSPELASKPIAVGSMQMISTSNYIARRYGVRAGMAGFIGKKLCPDLVLVRHNFQKYKDAAGQVRSILSQYDPKFTSGGMDEAYLDLTQYLHNVRFFSEKTQRTFEFRRVCSCFCHNLTGVTKNSAHDKPGLKQTSMPGTSKNYQPYNNEPSHSFDTRLLACFCSFCWRERVIGGQVKMIQEFSTPGCHLAMRNISNPQTTPIEENINICEHSLNQKETQDCTAITFGITAEEAVREIRLRVYELTGLTCSAGIAPTRLLAKIGTDINKPNGQFILGHDKDKVMAFVSKTPINKVNGIGRVTNALLNSLGIERCGDIWEHREDLGLLYSDVFCCFLAYIYAGGQSGGHELDQSSDSEDDEFGGRKSIGIERTVVHTNSRRQSLKEDSDIYDTCASLCESLSQDMKSRNLVGNVVAVKMKSSNFRVLTRMKTLLRATNDASIILKEALKMIKVELGLARQAAQFLRVKDPKVPKAKTQLSLKNVAEPISPKFETGLTMTKEMTVESFNQELKNPYIYNYYRNFAEDLSAPLSKFAQGQPNIVANHEDFLTLRLLGVRMCKLENSAAYDNQTKFLTNWMDAAKTKEDKTKILSYSDKDQTNYSDNEAVIIHQYPKKNDDFDGFKKIRLSENLNEILNHLGYSTNCPVCQKSLTFTIPPTKSLATLTDEIDLEIMQANLPPWLKNYYSDTLNTHLDLCLNTQALSKMSPEKFNNSDVKKSINTKRKNNSQESIIKFLKKSSP